MTTWSTHVYSARLVDPNGDIPLSLDRKGSASISFDAGRIPHVEARLTLALEDAMLLEDLDPRDSRRIIVTAGRDDGAPRIFNLGIRRVSPNRAAATADVTLASDEAILSEKAQLADDKNPRMHEASLRAVCSYVLGKIGAALQAGALDANVTAYWPVTNLILNGDFEVDTAGWGNGTNAMGLRRVNTRAFTGAWCMAWDSIGAGLSFASMAERVNVTAGKSYVLSARVGASAARNMQLILRWHNSAGTDVATQVYSPAVAAPAAGLVRASVIAVAPPGAEQASVHIQVDGPGQIAYADAIMLYEGTELIPEFNGATPDSATYIYDWAGPAYRSASTRKPVVERRPEALTWRAGVSGMDFLHPLLLSAGLRLVCDEQRRWTLRNEDYRADGAQAWRHGVNIKASPAPVEELSRDDDEWFDGAVYEYVWTDVDGSEQRRIDAYALKPNPSKVYRRELRDTPFPGPGRAQHVVERAQGKGRTVTVSGIPLWSENTDQPLSVLLAGSPIQTGIAASVAYDLANDTITISSRTTDTPPSAWDLIPGGQSWLASPAGATWIGEII